MHFESKKSVYATSQNCTPTDTKGDIMLKESAWKLFGYMAGLILFASCTPTLAPTETSPTRITTTVVMTPTPIPTLFSTPTAAVPATSTNAHQSDYRVADFSEDYYAIVHIEPQAKESDDIGNGFYKTGWIAIYDKESGQELVKVSSGRIHLDLEEDKVKANILEFPYGEQSLIIHDDFNFDGVKDFAIQDEQVSCYGGPAFQIFLAQDREFVFSSEFSRLAHEYCGMFVVDHQEQKIYTMTKSGCCWHEYSEFIVQDDKPIVQQIVTDELLPDYPFRMVTTKTWHAGEVTETSEKYLPLGDMKEDVVVSFDLLQSDEMVLLFGGTEILTYALTTPEGVVKFNFPPQRQFPTETKFEYISALPKVTLRFVNENTVYEIYQHMVGNEITEIGLQITEDGQTTVLEGDLSTIGGNLADIEMTAWNNVVFSSNE